MQNFSTETKNLLRWLSSLEASALAVDLGNRLWQLDKRGGGQIVFSLYDPETISIAIYTSEPGFSRTAFCLPVSRYAEAIAMIEAIADL